MVLRPCASSAGDTKFPFRIHFRATRRAPLRAKIFTTMRAVVDVAIIRERSAEREARSAERDRRFNAGLDAPEDDEEGAA